MSTSLSPTQPDRRPAVSRANTPNTILLAATLGVFVASSFQSRWQFGLRPEILVGRWVLYLLLAFTMGARLIRRRTEVPLPPAAAALLLFVVLTFLSTLYSTVPLLTAFKAGSFFLLVAGVTFAFVGAGLDGARLWIRILACANLAIIGFTMFSVVVAPGPSIVEGSLRGPFGNTNALGSALALTVPAILASRRYWRRPLMVGVVSVALIVNFAFIYWTRSRASLGTLILVLLVWALHRWGLRIVAVACLVAPVVLILAPSLVTYDRQGIFAKGPPASSLFQSRRTPFEASLAGASTSPVTGNGFGVAVGASQPSFTLTDIGREKGNALLGTVEEVGVVGAALLFVPLLTVTVRALSLSRRRRLGPQTRAMLAGLAAIGVAGLFHSSFEDWLTAAGSYEAFIFWPSMGAALGALLVVRRASGAREVTAA